MLHKVKGPTRNSNVNKHTDQFAILQIRDSCCPCWTQTPAGAITHTHMTFFERQSLTKSTVTYKITSLESEQSSCLSLVTERSDTVIGDLLGVRKVVDSVLGPISGYSE